MSPGSRDAVATNEPTVSASAYTSGVSHGMGGEL